MPQGRDAEGVRWGSRCWLGLRSRAHGPEALQSFGSLSRSLCEDGQAGRGDPSLDTKNPWPEGGWCDMLW